MENKLTEHNQIQEIQKQLQLCSEELGRPLTRLTLRDFKTWREARHSTSTQK
jgi:hypothetical protein